MTSIPDQKIKTTRRVGGIFQCVECRSLFGGSSSTGISSGPEGSSSVNDVHGGMRVSYSTVRLSAKILFRRCSGTLGLEQASKIDRLMHKHDEQQLLAAREKECSSSRGSSSSSRPEQNEEDSVQVSETGEGADNNISRCCLSADDDGALPRNAWLYAMP